MNLEEAIEMVGDEIGFYHTPTEKFMDAWEFICKEAKLGEKVRKLSPDSMELCNVTIGSDILWIVTTQPGSSEYSGNTPEEALDNAFNDRNGIKK